MPDIFVEQPNHRPEEHKIENVQPQNPIKLNPHHSHNVHIFSTFVRHPLGISIAEQHEDEHILLFIRRDFITNIPWILLALLLLVVPFFVPALFSPLHITFSFFSPVALILLTVFYYLIVLGFVFANFVTWFYDIGIVTEQRSVDIDFYNISYVSVATARSQDLKDVRYNQQGFFESFFDYGDVSLVVEAAGETLTFEKTPRPAEVVSILSALIGGHQP